MNSLILSDMLVVVVQEVMQQNGRGLKLALCHATLLLTTPRIAQLKR